MLANFVRATESDPRKIYSEKSISELRRTLFWWPRFRTRPTQMGYEARSGAR
jgi:hypothetical protein